MTITSAARVEWPSPGPTRHPITVDEYFRMGEARVLAQDARCELIEGEIIDMPRWQEQPEQQGFASWQAVHQAASPR